MNRTQVDSTSSQRVKTVSQRTQRYSLFFQFPSTVELQQSDTGVFRHPVTSHKKIMVPKYLSKKIRSISKSCTIPRPLMCHIKTGSTVVPVINHNNVLPLKFPVIFFHIFLSLFPFVNQNLSEKNKMIQMLYSFSHIDDLSRFWLSCLGRLVLLLSKL